MKILLLKPYLFEFTKGFLFFKSRKKVNVGQTSYSPPLGLLYIARSLEDEGHTVEVIDFFCEENPQEILQKSLSSFDAIGLNVYSDNYGDSAYFANMIKQIDQDLPIFIGGPHCTFHPEKALVDIPAADISVEGEAEYVIKDIAKALEGKKKLHDIPAIRYRKKEEIKKGKPPCLIKDLDSIPFPARHLIEKYEYGKINNIYFHKPKFTSIITSRGCPFQCRFCTRDFETIRMYRQRSPENVIEEFKELDEKYGSVTIVDDNFLVDKKRNHKIMDGLIKLGIDLELYIQGARADAGDKELYIKMKKAGVKSIFYGIESGCQDVLDFYNKNITLNQIQKTVKFAHEMGFLTVGSFILGAPIETEHHIKQTIKFACSLPLDITIWRHLQYKYGSKLWYEAVENGKIDENHCDYVLADSRIGLGNFTLEELEKLCKKASNRFYLRPNYIFREIVRSFMRRDLTVFKAGLELL